MKTVELSVPAIELPEIWGLLDSRSGGLVTALDGDGVGFMAFKSRAEAEAAAVAHADEWDIEAVPTLIVSHGLA